MEKQKLLIGLVLLGGIYTGCAPSRFSVESSCNTNASGSCVTSNGQTSYSDSFTVAGGKIDILLVDDNSASMSSEQHQLANRFGTLISQLDSQHVDYHIAITTTDISSGSNAARSINQNGALQDGHLIAFPGGGKFLSSTDGSTQSRTSAFAQTVQRSETLTCENFITNWLASGKSTASADYSSNYAANCPSTDERGIYAARLSLANNEAGFLRRDADLAVIFLADEDVRSQLYWNNTPGYALEDMDKAANLVSYIQSTFPQKKFGVHSIVVTSQQCLASQGQQLNGSVSGSYGTEYAKASTLSHGVIGDICSADYGYIMNAIFSNITANLVDKIPLGCGNPSGLQVTNSANIAGQVVGSAYVFNQKLPVGTQVSYSYTCGSSAQ